MQIAIAWNAKAYFLEKNHTKIFQNVCCYLNIFLIFPENRLWHFMQQSPA